jgi:hypothetical protein
MSDGRVERHGAVGLAAVQIQRDARGRQVGIEQRDEDVEQNRCASERRVREKEQLALRRNEIKSQYDICATTIHSERFGRPTRPAAHDGGRDIIAFPMRRCVALLCALGLAATVSVGCTSAVTSPSNNVPFSSTDLVVGTGATASVGRALTVNYTGWLYDATQPENKGLVFDTSLGKTPFLFTLGAGQVIGGWERGLLGMQVGGTRRLVIPPSLAYGGTRSNVIPAYTTLVFDIELVGVQ